MKTVLCILFVLFAGMAFGQNGVVLNSTVQPLQMMDHVEHAMQHAMGQENTLLDTSTYSYGHGEVPLAELGTISYETPLGDVARAYKKEHAATGLKATRVFEK